MFKIKYCHEIFDIEEVRMFVFDLLIYISINYNMPIKKVGFDSDHVHFRVDIKLRSKPEAAKVFRGITGKFILKKFPEIKKKYFWGSGFWNPAYLLDNIGNDEESVDNYISSQKYPIN
jgi:putative transposase